MYSSSSSSRPAFGGMSSSISKTTPGWLMEMADNNTLSPFVDTQSQHIHLPDEIGDNTLFKDLDLETTIKDFTVDRTMEPLMGIDKITKAELEKKNPSVAFGALLPAAASTCQVKAVTAKPPMKKEKKATEAKPRQSQQGPTPASSGSAGKGMNPQSVASTNAIHVPVVSTPKPSVIPSTYARPFQAPVKNVQHQPASSSVAPINTTPSSTGSGCNRKGQQPGSGSKTDPDNEFKRTAANFSAFFHLYYPCMTPIERDAIIDLYKGREMELWHDLERRLGPNAVPARFLRPTEAAKGSVKLQLKPKNDDEQTIRIMKDKRIKPAAKQTIGRTTTVSQLTSDLEFRWKPVDEHFRRQGYRLFLFSVDSDDVLPAKAIIRDFIVANCIEFAWCLEPTEEEDSWGRGHSLSALPSSLAEMEQPTKRRIQPIPVAQDSVSKRIHADVTMAE